MLERWPVLSWALRSAAARCLGACIGLGVAFGFMRFFGEATTGPLLFLQIGLSIAASLLHGTVFGLFTARALERFLPEADLGLFVRNTMLVAGLGAVLVQLPTVLRWLLPHAGYEYGGGTDHTLAMVTCALLIGPAQYWAFRGYRGAGRYIVASLAAQLLGLALDWTLQSLLFGTGFDSLAGATARIGGITAIGFVVALPTALALRGIARTNAGAPP